MPFGNCRTRAFNKRTIEVNKIKNSYIENTPLYRNSLNHRWVPGNPLKIFFESEKICVSPHFLRVCKFAYSFLFYLMLSLMLFFSIVKFLHYNSLQRTSLQPSTFTHFSSPAHINFPDNSNTLTIIDRTRCPALNYLDNGVLDKWGIAETKIAVLQVVQEKLSDP